MGEGDRDAGRGVIDSIAQRDSILCDISPHEEHRSDPPPLHGHFAGAGLGSTLVPGVLWARMQDAGAQKVTLAMVNDALKLSGIEVTEDEKTGLVEGANRNLTGYERSAQAPHSARRLAAVPFQPGRRRA